MATFKEGDWVRALVGDEVVSVGDVGRVAKSDRTVTHVDWVGKRRWAYINSEMEPWTPKVGERVLYKDDMVTGVGVVESVDGAHDEALSIGIYVDEKDLDFAYYGHNDVRLFEAKHLSPITEEPLPVAAEAQPAASVAEPLTIQAGKFYKTRDGRKVGPMKSSGRTYDYFWTDGKPRDPADYYSRDWCDDGTFHKSKPNHPLDLISEWPDTTATTTNTAATVDALDEEYGPGMRKERPWDRYRDVVADRDNDTVGLTVSLDTSELHEELDAVISKLKKIRKLQRELGLIAA